MTIRHQNRSRQRSVAKKRNCCCDWCWRNTEKRRKIEIPVREMRVEATK